MTATLPSPDALFAVNPAIAAGFGTGTNPATNTAQGLQSDGRNPRGTFASALRNVQNRNAVGSPVDAQAPAQTSRTPSLLTTPDTNSPTPTNALRQVVAGGPLPLGGTPLPPSAITLESSGEEQLFATDAPALANTESPATTPELPSVLSGLGAELSRQSLPDGVAPSNGSRTIEIDPAANTARGAAGLSAPELAGNNKGAGAHSQPGTQSGQQQFQAAQAQFEPAAAETGDEFVQARDSLKTAGFKLAAEPSAFNAPGPIGNELRAISDSIPELREATRPLQPLADNQKWSNGLSERLLSMTESGTQTARIKLHPEHLGPLDVRISIEDDTARVWFGAQHAQTREALEAALPRLREMLANQGLELIQTDIDSGQEQHAHDEIFGLHGDATDTATDAALSPAMDGMSAHSPPPSLRLVDTYA